MTTISHAIFGQIDPSASEFWEASIDHAGKTVSIDMTIEEGDVSRKTFDLRSRCPWRH